MTLEHANTTRRERCRHIDQALEDPWGEAEHQFLPKRCEALYWPVSQLGGTRLSIRHTFHILARHGASQWLTRSHGTVYDQIRSP